MKRKIAFIPYPFLFSMLQGIQDKGCFRLPHATIPGTAKLISVHNSPERASFMVVIEDISFEETAPGCTYPEFPLEWRDIYVE